jgi:3-hydroxyacyl-[acyl-carrier-protein] dehydratase
MRFTLLDRISDLQPGVKIVASKNVSLAEEYLADHFPQFPVLPGVLMLEAMTQCAAWLIRYSEDFAHSMVVVKEARNVKYADFVKPGGTLQVEVEMLENGPRLAKVKAQGIVNGVVSVSGRLVLEKYNLADTNPAMKGTDAQLRQDLRRLFDLLYHPPVPGEQVADGAGAAS